MGRVTQLTLPDQSSASWHYNAAHLKEIRRHKNNQVLYSHQQDRHDLSGNILQSGHIGNAGRTHYAYDGLGRVCNISHANWGLQIPSEGYDAAGRLVKKMTQDRAGSKEELFTYTSLDHLKTETGDTPYSYHTDSLHNRLRKNHQNCSINALNQLIQDGHSHYNYDRNGCLLEKSSVNQKTTYTYDALDRLISVASEEGETTYTYDPFNRRIAKNHHGVLYRYLYQGENEIGCVDSEGTITELRILGIGIDAEIGSAIALELQGKAYAPIHDNHGNIVCLIDAETGIPSETYRYSAFGEEKIFDASGVPVHDSLIGNPWRFASKRKDAETGWIHFGRRYYDPENGRWTTPDPLGFDDGVNLYAYLHHNPLNAYDAYGLQYEAYTDSTKAAQSAVNYAGPFAFSGLDLRSDPTSNQDRASYISGSNAHACAAGIAHGGVDFVSGQCCSLALGCYCVGRIDFDDDWETQKNITNAYMQSQADIMDSFNNRVTNFLGVDPNNTVYQASRKCTRIGLEAAVIVAGGVNLVRGGILAVRSSFQVGTKFAGNASKVARQELKCAVSSGAENVNAGLRLKHKLASQEIAGGHAFKKHAAEFGFTTKEQMALHIENVMNNPTRIRQLERGRTAYWHEPSGTIVFRDSKRIDGGTAFISKKGKNYFYEEIE